MPSAPDRTPAPARRVLSRLSSPFAASKSRHIAEFVVNPDDEHRRYSPGDTVTGHVRLRVVKPIRITHLVICLYGFAQVYKQPISPGEGTPALARGKKAGEQFGNGFALLCEDEVVLCGDGRLAEGLYQFNFELLFPEHPLPSSIDFERGTISYMITATLTRPNAISPTIVCERKVTFVERIDVASLLPPKAQTITLTPLPKRSRARRATRKLGTTVEKNDNSDPARSDSNTPRPSDASSDHSGRVEWHMSGSARQSEHSSAISAGSARHHASSDQSSRASPSPSDTGRSQDTKLSLSQKVVAINMESQVGGCLQGDSISVKVDVAHTKPVRSLYGVIVTLFRQGRVDMRPAVPLEPVEKGKGGKGEDYYPKSITGLAGLSLSGAGSSHVFRKDLSQVVRPLYVDPQDLTAEVNARVHVPDDAFPTITTVPGSIISFRYYVEMIVDIQGKLQGQEKGNTNVTGERVVTTQLGSEDSERGRLAHTASTPAIIDTAPVRRDKGVVSWTFEVIVGTKDSERKKGKRKVVTRDVPSESPPVQSPHVGSNVHLTAEPGAHEYGMNYYHESSWYDSNYGYQDAGHGQYYAPYSDASYENQPPPPPPPAPLVPLSQEESQMTEKERIRHAEIRLLPSQPPGTEQEEAEETAGATAPYLLDGDGGEDDLAPAAPRSAPEYGAIASESAQPDPRVTTDLARPGQATLAQEYANQSTSGDALMVSRSTAAPATRTGWDEDEARAAVVGYTDEADEVIPPEAESSAPMGHQVDEGAASVHDSHADAAGSSDLPRYER